MWDACLWRARTVRRSQRARRTWQRYWVRFSRCGEGECRRLGPLGGQRRGDVGRERVGGQRVRFGGRPLRSRHCVRLARRREGECLRPCAGRQREGLRCRLRSSRKCVGIWQCILKLSVINWRGSMLWAM